jgi:ATP-dependent DNA helicase DinG
MREKPGGFLFPNDFAVLDEAHTIEQVAAVQLGLRVSQAGLRFDLQRLYHPKTRKGLLKSLPQGLRDAGGREAIWRGRPVFPRTRRCAKFGEFSKECRVREPEVVQNTVATPLRGCGRKSTRSPPDVESEPRGRAAGRLAAAARGAWRGGAFLDQQDEDSVYWVERGGRDETQYSLHAAPVNVADRLRPLLFGPGKSWF